MIVETGTVRRRLFFWLQSLRGGVNEAMIEETAALLDEGWEALEPHARCRLAALHGPEAADPEWLRSQPLTERSSLRGRVAEIESVGPAGVEWRRTSGSTGTPFRFPKDREMAEWMDAVKWAVYRWHGIAPGDRHAQLWGMPQSSFGRARRRVLDSLLGRSRLSAFEISSRRSVDFFHRLRRAEPRYMHGYTSLIREFVAHCTSAGLEGKDLGLSAVICTGELMPPGYRDLFRSFFDCSILNEYGCTESGTIAFDCESGTLHRVPVAAWSEILDDGEEAAPGSTGEVVVTDLYGQTLALVRYRLHDRARNVGFVDCGCGRELPALVLDEGRIDNFIITPSRGKVYDAILAYTVPKEVLRFRAFQRAEDHLEVHLVPGPGFERARTPELCRRRWEKALGPGLTVTTEVVESVPLSHSGKLQYFVPLSHSDARELPDVKLAEAAADELQSV